MDLTLAAVAVGVCAFAAAGQAVTGFGFALIAVPLLAMLVGPEGAIAAAVLIGLVLTVVVSVREFSQVDWKTFVATSVPACLGLPVGIVALDSLSSRALTIVISCVVLVLVGLMTVGFTLPARRSTDVATGFISGGLLTSTGMSGPVLVLGLQGREMTPRRLRGTLTAGFAVQNIGAALTLWLSGNIPASGVQVALVCALPAVLGWLAGDRIFHRVSPRVLGQAVMGLVVVTAAAGLWRGLV